MELRRRRASAPTPATTAPRCGHHQPACARGWSPPPALAGQGDDPKYPGWNDFILHNSQRPNAKAFRNGAAPSLANGNILLVTEEDYEQPDCSKAGSFQTWWVKRLDGTKNAIVPLDKVELSDLGTLPAAGQGAFCSSHWFDFHPSGIVAAGFYGGGTQLIDVRNPKDIKSYGHATWGASEVWDSYWMPVYSQGRRDDGEEDQPRLLRRPRPRDRRLPRRPARDELGHDRGLDRARAAAAG